MRIYKGSEITLKLYTRINCQSIEADKMRVVLFTTNPNNSYMVNNVVVSGDTLLVTVGRNDLNEMEDGVINYIILGYDDNEEIYNSTRQSNYYLKTPDGYVAKSVQTSKDIYIVDNGDYKVLPDEDYSSIEEVNVHVELDTEPYIQRGIEIGEENQKAKLESISINENGTYSREDGYNEITVEVPDLNGDYQTGYDEGYNVGYDEGEENGIANAGEIIAQTARVLEVTENGTYLSQYSETIYPDTITGVYPDGENFYSYSELNGAVYNTKIAGSIDNRLEFWYKGYNIKVGDAYNLIIGSGDADNSDCFQVRYQSTFNNSLWIEVGNSRITVNDWDDTVWHHFIVSKAEGLWIDGEKKGDFSPSNTVNGEFYINGIGYDVNNMNNGRNANGYFGMIKITTNGVENIIIPTADGFLNTSTNELLEVVKDGSYYFTEELPIIPEGNLIKTVNVNVVPKINVWDNNIKFGESQFDYIPKVFDFSGRPISLEGLFRNCRNLLELPYIDTSSVVNYSEWLYRTSITNIPFEIVLNENTTCDKMFYYSSLNEIPFFDTSNVTSIHYMFGYSENLKTIPQFDFSKVTNYQYWIESCTNLESLPYFDFTNVTSSTNFLVGFGGNLSKLTEIGGFALKQSCTGNYGLVKMPNLSYQSCINQLNALYDFIGNGETPTSSQGQLKVHQNFLDLVGDEISIGTNKGWTITA